MREPSAEPPAKLSPARSIQKPPTSQPTVRSSSSHEPTVSRNPDRSSSSCRRPPKSTRLPGAPGTPIGVPNGALVTSCGVRAPVIAPFRYSARTQTGPGVAAATTVTAGPTCGNTDTTGGTGATAGSGAATGAGGGIASNVCDGVPTGVPGSGGPSAVGVAGGATMTREQVRPKTLAHWPGRWRGATDERACRPAWGHLSKGGRSGQVPALEPCRSVDRPWRAGPNSEFGELAAVVERAGKAARSGSRWQNGEQGRFGAVGPEACGHICTVRRRYWTVYLPYGNTMIPPPIPGLATFDFPVPGTGAETMPQRSSRFDTAAVPRPRSPKL